MKPAPFEYRAPVELGEALGLLAEHGEDARALAGGQSLVPLLALRMARFGVLVDLNRVAGLGEVRVVDGVLVVGAMVRQVVVGADRVIGGHSPLLAEATGLVGHFQIRNRGTLGGSLAHADPTAEYPAVALALDAEVELASAGGARRVAVEGFLDSAFVTRLAVGELVVGVRFGDWGPRSGFAVQEIARRRGDFALVGAVAAVALDESGGVARGRVVVFGVAERPVRLEGVSFVEAEIEAAAVGATAGLTPPDDALATGAYRRRMAGPLAAKVIRTALTRARARARA